MSNLRRVLLRLLIVASDQRRVLARPSANWERRSCKEQLLKIYRF